MANSSDLSFMSMNPPPLGRAAAGAADLHRVANQEMALLLMKTHRSIQ